MNDGLKAISYFETTYQNNSRVQFAIMKLNNKIKAVAKE